MAGEAAIFVKRIDDLSVTIDWFDLPPNADGFKGYYRNYKIGLDGLELMMLQPLVEIDLLGSHGFRFHNQLRAAFLG